MVEPVKVPDTTTPNPQETVAKEVKDNNVTPKDAANVVADAAKETEETTLLGEEPEKEETKAAVPEVVVPEKYEFKVPEGMEVDTKLVETITPIFKELKLSQEQAQKLVDVYAPYVKQMVDTQHTQMLDQFHKLKGEWKTETQKVLGDGAKEKLAIAAKAINKFGTPELRTLLDESGVGNHKEMVNFFIKIGELVSEDKFTSTKETPPKNSDMSILYPTMQT